MMNVSLAGMGKDIFLQHGKEQYSYFNMEIIINTESVRNQESITSLFYVIIVALERMSSLAE
jgi:hypothetical protein